MPFKFASKWNSVIETPIKTLANRSFGLPASSVHRGSAAEKSGARRNFNERIILRVFKNKAVNSLKSSESRERLRADLFLRGAHHSHCYQKRVQFFSIFFRVVFEGGFERKRKNLQTEWWNRVAHAGDKQG